MSMVGPVEGGAQRDPMSFSNPKQDDEIGEHVASGPRVVKGGIEVPPSIRVSGGRGDDNDGDDSHVRVSR